MKEQIRYSPQIRERAARLMHGHQGEYESQGMAMVSITAKNGCTPETLRTLVPQSKTAQGI
ncbi:transposase [Nitrosomonas communis]|uniref:Transposase n=1 Tax=Nitrosomonas communis TaxID=44574 RepID=A0A1I4NZD0_9PROT|nr:transposase [Nitrosomonas communis]